MSATVVTLSERSEARGPELHVRRKVGGVEEFRLRRCAQDDISLAYRPPVRPSPVRLARSAKSPYRYE